MDMLETCDHVTGGLIISESKLQSSPKLRTNYNSVKTLTIFCNYLYNSIQDIRYTKNGQNQFISLIYSGYCSELFQNTYAKSI